MPIELVSRRRMSDFEDEEKVPLVQSSYGTIGEAGASGSVRQRRRRVPSSFLPGAEVTIEMGTAAGEEEESLRQPSASEFKPGRSFRYLGCGRMEAMSDTDISKALALAEANGDGDDIDSVDLSPTPEQMLWLYIRTGDSDRIRKLFHFCDVDIHSHDTTPYGCRSTALHFACEFGQLHLVKLLLEFKADLECLNKFRSTPLHIAASHGRGEIVDFLLKAKANLNALNIVHNTPLHCAVYFGDIPTVKLLVRAARKPEEALKRLNGVGMRPWNYSDLPTFSLFIKEFDLRELIAAE